MSDEQNPYLLYPEHEVDRRPRYYDGQFLRSADFIDAQRYGIDRHRRHLEAAVTPGVVAGLDVSGGADRVTVAPGAAVDDSGRQIVLVAATEKAIAAADRGRNLTLYIAYAELASDESQGEQGTAGFTRFHEMPSIAYLGSADALPAGAVRLASLQVDAAGAVTVDTSTRPRAGLRIPGPTPLTMTSREADPGRATLDAALAITVPAGTAHGSEAPALDVDGFGRIKGGLIIGQASATGYGGVLNDANDLIVAGQLAAAGSGGSAIYKLGVGYGPPSQGEGTLTAQRAAIGRQDVASGYVAHVEGKAKVSGNTDIGGDVSVARTLGVTGNTNLGASLAVTAGATVGGDLGVTGALNATGAATLGAGLAVAGAATVGGTLGVTGAATIGGALSVQSGASTTGAVSVGTTLTTGSDASVGRDLGVTRNLNAGGTITSGGGGTIGGALGVAGALTVGTDATLNGRNLLVGAGVTGRDANAGYIKYAVHSDALELFGAGTNSNNTRKIKLYAEGGTSTTGALTVGSTLTSGGKLTVSGGGVDVTGNGVIRSGLVVGQSDTVGYGGIAQDGNDLVVNGQFAAGGSGGAAMYSLAIGAAPQGGKEGYLFVNSRAAIGRSSADRTLDVSGTARVSGDTELGGALSVTGATSLAGALNVTGATRVNERLTVQHGETAGIRFVDDPYGGSGDWAGLRYWRVAGSGENTRLELGTGNDFNDLIVLKQYDLDVITLRTGRVGVLTDTPAEALHVIGKVRVDNDYAVVAPTNKVRVCFGLFDQNGNTITARGLSCSKTGRGAYAISFSVAFAVRPACFAQQYGDGNNKDGALVANMYTDRCTVTTGDNDGDRDDRAFCILAIGDVS